MKRTLIILGTLASIAVLSDTAWAVRTAAAAAAAYVPRAAARCTTRGGGGFGAVPSWRGARGSSAVLLPPKPNPKPENSLDLTLTQRTRTTKKSEPEKKKLVRPAAVTEPPKTKVSRVPP